MTKLKYLHRLFILFFMGCTMCALQACSDNNEEEILSDLVGTWYGYNESGGRETNVTITFKSDKTGTMIRSSYGSTGFRSEQRYFFTYSVNGKTIQCDGHHVGAYSDGEVVNEPYIATFTYDNGKLTGGTFRDIKIFSKK